ncbi:EAL domain-containing protein [Butyrivibrio sp. X503]|uniref:EAL domain-containing protein n=1 Tax=Butyrivibrio sp. X503 TaxID=2364878 RepID=UPI001A9BC0DC|nr:EAL domain-containing protein [Butyrivibrio sp. X503]
MLFFAACMATISECIESTLQLHPIDAPWYNPFEMICGSVYFLAHLGTGISYLLYIMSVLDIFFDIKTIKGFFALYFGFFLGTLLVIVNWIHPILFHYTKEGLYQRDSLIIMFYLIAFYYMGFGIALVLKYDKLMRLKTKVIVLAYVGLTLFGIIFQYFNPDILIENFYSAISVALVFITLQNPGELVDENLNILNRKAFFEGLDLKIKRNIPYYTVFVSIDNVRALSSEIGYSQAQAVLKKIADYLKRAGRKEIRLTTYTYRFSDYVFAIMVHSDNEKKAKELAKALAKRTEKSFDVSGMTIKIDGHCFVMNYPEHYKSVAELMTKVDVITEEIAELGDVFVDIDTLDHGEKMLLKDYDFLARENLDAKKAVVKFQPLLSKIYKINYNADSICFFYDKNGNEIDVRNHIPDIGTTQTIMDTDEYVLRMAARSLAFWNGGDKNGKYRAVVGMCQGEISRNDFVRRVKRILREEKAEPSWISLKLSETCLTTMNTIAERNIRMLEDLKISIIVDRFGSGYGNLSKIISLPIMQVNISPEVIRNAIGSEQMYKLAQGIVNLFHDISIFVCACDIRSKEEKEMAEKLGCDFLIGDYLGVPMSDSSYVRFIDEYFEKG